MNKNLFLPLLVLFSTALCSNYILENNDQPIVYIYANNSKYSESALDSLNKFNIKFKVVDTINNTNDQNLYIIFDVFNINKSDLPKYYISYQSLDLTNNQLTNEYLDKLANSVAVWDYSKKNIHKYNSRIYNYYYFPKNYKNADPVILPCFMPVSTLSDYKKLLIYSNQKDTDISSHLPALFCHTVLQNPKIIVEAGVRGGESTIPFRESLKFCDAKLIGIDIEKTAAKPYSEIEQAIFLLMDDLDFNTYLKNSPFNNKKMDIIFIDTTHEYEQTIKEIALFEPLLADNGFLSFHDSNVTPLADAGYIRLNGTSDKAHGNPRGVPQAIKEYFSLEFDEYNYFNSNFIRDGVVWNITHYPFCNGLTIIKKIIQNPNV